jgi:putative nucleotidyltransferase with HDIG domain
MKSILFVDDEPRVLNGLKRMLFPFGDLWLTEFAAGGAEALAILAERNFDVIVADMRMPVMNGAELLAEVTRRFPHMVRIILSGTWDQDLRMQAAMTAHQYLSKPCDPEMLKATLDRAFTLREVLMSPGLKELISRTVSLPSAPAIYTQLIQALRNPEVSAQQLGAMIAQDIGMSAKVLQLVNSAFFGLRRHIANPEEAVFFLGVDTIKALTLSISAFSMFSASKCPRFSIDALQRHSTAVAAIAREIAKFQKITKLDVDDTFAAGLLHDVGKLVLVANHPELYDRVLNAVARGEKSAIEAEREVFGTTHAEVGGYLLWLWGLPDTVVEAVTFHHRPSACPAERFGPLTGVHVANILELSVAFDAPARETDVDTDYLARIGAVQQLPEWWRLGQEQLSPQV